MGSSKFYFYLHKYVYFIIIVQNCLGRFINEGWPTIYRLAFSKTLLSIDFKSKSDCSVTYD
jgi:hypothetical protein